MDAPEACSLQLHHEIETLLLDYWHEVDAHWGEHAHEFFVADGVFRNSVGRARVGRAAIQEFYGSRQARGPRIARHVVTNLRVLPPAPDGDVTARWIMLLHAADGEPMLPSEPAILIADVTDVCRKEADGRWRYVSRTIVGLFKGDKPTTT